MAREKERVTQQIARARIWRRFRSGWPLFYHSYMTVRHFYHEFTRVFWYVFVHFAPKIILSAWLYDSTIAWFLMYINLHYCVRKRNQNNYHWLSLLQSQCIFVILPMIVLKIGLRITIILQNMENMKYKLCQRYDF